MIQLQNISHGYSGKFLYENLSFTFKPQTKYALVGANGIGKSTLFNIITHQVQPNRGNVTKPSDIEIEYLTQSVDSDVSLTVLETALSGFKNVLELEQQIFQLNNSLVNETSDKVIQSTLEKIDTFTQIYEQNNGYALEANAKKILSGLGFSNDAFSKPLAEFSGGWRMRANLAKMLLKSPDYLLLDEPTNHLDIESLKWLESFLKSYEKSVIIISHDRIFLDEIVSKTLELTAHGIVEYHGNYSFYEIERENQLLASVKQNEKIQREVSHIQSFVDRFRYKASKAKQVQSRIKMLEKYALNTISTSAKSIQLSFKTSRPSGHIVCSFDELSKSYDRPILQHITGTIYRGDRIALMGANGSGKSTFLKLIMNKIKSSSGTVDLGQKVSIGYYEQHQIESLNPEHTIFEEVQSVAIPEKRTQVRDVLGALLFSGETIDKHISVLSGGEKARVALAKILVSDINTLILDEPTNHLDIQAKEALQVALDQFDGTLLIVSHDRDFLSTLVEDYYYFKNCGFFHVKGTFEDVEDQLTKREDEHTQHDMSDEKRSKKMEFKEAKKLKNQINKLEKEIVALEEEIESKNIEKEELTKKQYSEKDNKRVVELQEKIENITTEIFNIEAQWETKSEQLEHLQTELD